MVVNPQTGQVAPTAMLRTVKITTLSSMATESIRSGTSGSMGSARFVDDEFISHYTNSSQSTCTKSDEEPFLRVHSSRRDNFSHGLLGLSRGCVPKRYRLLVREKLPKLNIEKHGLGPSELKHRTSHWTLSDCRLLEGQIYSFLEYHFWL